MLLVSGRSSCENSPPCELDSRSITYFSPHNPACSGILTLSLWAILIAIVYKLATTKIDSRIYDPFEILGLAPVRPFLASLIVLHSCNRLDIG